MFQVTIAPHDTKIWINPLNVLSVRPASPEGSILTMVGGSTITCQEGDRFIADCVSAVIAPSSGPRRIEAGQEQTSDKVYAEGDD